MELLFIDESGDDGLAEGSSEFYILSGVAVEDIFWKETYWKLRTFREKVTQKFGLLKVELKGEEIFQHEGALFNSGLVPYDQQWICERLVELIADELKVECFISSKSKTSFRHRHTIPMLNPAKIFRQEIWSEYLSSYERYLMDKTEKLGHPQTGMIFYDKNHEKYVRSFVRRFTRKFDVKSPFLGAGLIEDVVFYDSRASLFIQLADFLSSFSLRKVRGKSRKDAFVITREMIDKLQSKVGAFVEE